MCAVFHYSLLYVLKQISLKLVIVRVDHSKEIPVILKENNFLYEYRTIDIDIWDCKGFMFDQEVIQTNQHSTRHYEIIEQVTL